jgi:hypothetical protein
MSTIAVFVVLGGTSYAALTLPRNSVGQRQIKSGSVGSSEIARGAVRSRAVRNGAIERRDLSAAAIDSLMGRVGPQGPPGVPAIALRASVNSGGDIVRGSAGLTDGIPPNKRTINFMRDLTGCVPGATLARNPGGSTLDPGAGRIVVAVQGNLVAVETYNAAGAPEFLPFNVIVAC